MYANFARGSERVFDNLNKDDVSWTMLIVAYVRNKRFCDAFKLFDKMRTEYLAIDNFVAASILAACTSFGALKQGDWIHEYVKSRGIYMDHRLETTICIYCKCGCLEKAYKVFDEWPSKGISSWNCMIGGFAMHGKGKAPFSFSGKWYRIRRLLPIMSCL